LRKEDFTDSAPNLYALVLFLTALRATFAT